MYKIYADGGCAPTNPGPGGYAFRIEAPDGRVLEGWGHERSSTNNRMEILAAKHALQCIPEGMSVELICDSQYVLSGCQSWRQGWQRRGMRKADGSAVLNAELWLELWAEVDKRKVKYTWVRGHSGVPGNERVDELAGMARQKQDTFQPAAIGYAVTLPEPNQVLHATTASENNAASATARAAAELQSMLGQLLSAKLAMALRPDAGLHIPELAQSVAQLLARLGWRPPNG